MKELNPLWAKILNNIKPPSTQALFREMAELIQLNIPSKTAIINLKYPTIFLLAKKKKDNIKQAFFYLFGMDFKLTLTCGQIPNITNDSDDLTEEAFLNKLQQIRQQLPPNQTLIGKGWFNILFPER